MDTSKSDGQSADFGCNIMDAGHCLSINESVLNVMMST